MASVDDIRQRLYDAASRIEATSDSEDALFLYFIEHGLDPMQILDVALEFAEKEEDLAEESRALIAGAILSGIALGLSMKEDT